MQTVNLSKAPIRGVVKIDESEAVIDNHASGSLDRGRAFYEIKRARLHEETGDTFTDYCLRRWQLGRTQVFREIKAYKFVKKVLLPMGNIEMPTCERQVRPLVGLPPKLARAIWREVVARPSGAPLTAVLVAETKRLLYPPPWNFQSSPIGTVPNLSGEQQTIVESWAIGLKNKEIALNLGVAVSTIRTQANRIFKKLGVGTQAAAVARWLTQTERLTNSV